MCGAAACAAYRLLANRRISDDVATKLFRTFADLLAGGAAAHPAQTRSRTTLGDLVLGKGGKEARRRDRTIAIERDVSSPRRITNL